MNDKQLTEFTRANWYRIDKEKREEIVAMLRKELNMDSFRRAMDADPHGWSTKSGWHMFGGMGIRNLLREKGFTDDQLPKVAYPHGEAQNWDDFYTAALEAAAGVIDV